MHQGFIVDAGERGDSNEEQQAEAPALSGCDEDSGLKSAWKRRRSDGDELGPFSFWRPSPGPHLFLHRSHRPRWPLREIYFSRHTYPFAFSYSLKRCYSYLGKTRFADAAQAWESVSICCLAHLFNQLVTNVMCELRFART